MSEICPLCQSTATSREITVRSGKLMTLWHCAACQFDFFAQDPTAGLVANQLDQTRLKAAGLDIPSVEKDFANGLTQSRPHLEEYLNEGDAGRNILEIGCSWGYFLKLVQEAGAKPFGLELNTVRQGYVQEHLQIPCFPHLEACEGAGVRFKKIFLFYVMEYIPSPVAYFKRLLALLEDDGEIIAITPNLQDPLKDLWNNAGFQRFFYDEHAVNYFTPQAVRRLVEATGAPSSEVLTRQGYSFVNHANWFLTQKPTTTGMVGGDYFIREILKQVRSAPQTLSVPLAAMIEEFDQRYRAFLEGHDFGNQIRFRLARKA